MGYRDQVFKHSEHPPSAVEEVAPDTPGDRDPFRSLDQPLLYLSKKHGVPADPFTLENACQGTQIFGATGSGKTTGSGKALALAFLAARFQGDQRFGGLVLTAKPDDLSQWVSYCRDLEMTDAEICDRLLVVEPPGDRHPMLVWPQARGGDGRERPEPLELPVCRGLNFMDYEFRAGRGTRKSGGLTQDIVSLFVNCLSPGGASVSRADPYWDDALRELLTHAVDLVVFGTRAVGIQAGRLDAEPRLTLEDLTEVIRTAPQSRAEAASSAWRNPKTSLCWRFLHAANEQLAKCGRLHAEEEEGRFRDLVQTVDYWMSAFPSLNDRTRSVVVSSFTSKATGLLRHPLRELLCGDVASGPIAVPEVTHQGKIVILNLPVKLYGEVGRFAQAIWKTVWQRATERRTALLRGGDGAQSPVFLWADESQYFVTREDALFQQTARSARAATVYLTQSISNYYAALGGESSRPVIDSLLGNLQTKIFHANGDPVTNEWAEKLFGHWKMPVSSSGLSGGGPSTSNSETPQPLVPASRFTTLAKGGRNHKKVVQGYVFQGGRTWDGDGCVPTNEQRPSTALLASFDQ
jgi:hypothetical protein